MSQAVTHSFQLSSSQAAKLHQLYERRFCHRLILIPLRQRDIAPYLFISERFVRFEHAQERCIAIVFGVGIITTAVSLDLITNECLIHETRIEPPRVISK